MTKQTEQLNTNYWLPYQVDWVNDEGVAKLWDKSRRIGATYIESYAAVRKRNMIDYKRDYWFSSADESAAVEFAGYCRQWCEMFFAAVNVIYGQEKLEDEKGYRYTNYTIDFPNGSRINCMSSNPRRFRSKGGDVTLDEFDWHDDPGAMLDAAQPATTWGFNVVILTTRNGEGSEFDKLVKKAKQIISGELDPKIDAVLDWHYHFTPITVAVEQGLAEKIKQLDHFSQTARDQVIRECRARSRNQDAFNQEYMCIPSASALTLIPYDLYQSCEADCMGMDKYQGGQMFGGLDVGREKHLTSLWLAELVGDVLVVRKNLKLRAMPYGQQKEIIRDEIRACPNFVRCCGDATGIGDMLVEELARELGTGKVEKVKFSSSIKEHLASLVLGRLEDKRMRVPADRDTRESFHSVRKTVTATGNVRYDAVATDLGHADDFWSCGLCCEAAHNPIKPNIIML